MANIVSAEVPFSVLEAQTDLFQQSVLIDAHRSEAPSVDLIHFTLFGRSIHQLLRYDTEPLAYSALQCA